SDVHRRPALAHDVVDFGGLEPCIDWDRDETCLEAAVVAGCKLEAVRQVKCDAVARCEAQGEQVRGTGVGEAIELVIRPRAVAEHEGGSVGMRARLRSKRLDKSR